MWMVVAAPFRTFAPNSRCLRFGSRRRAAGISVGPEAGRRAAGIGGSAVLSLRRARWRRAGAAAVGGARPESAAARCCHCAGRRAAGIGCSAVPSPGRAARGRGGLRVQWRRGDGGGSGSGGGARRRRAAGSATARSGGGPGSARPESAPADVTMNVKPLYLMRGRFERLDSYSRRAARTAASIGVFFDRHFTYR